MATAMSTTNHDACGFNCNLHVRFFFLNSFFLVVALVWKFCLLCYLIECTVLVQVSIRITYDELNLFDFSSLFEYRKQLSECFFKRFTLPSKGFFDHFDACSPQ